MKLDKLVRTALVSSVLLVGAAPQAMAQNDNTVDVGVLQCEAVPGSRLNLIVRSTVDVKCSFKTSSGATENYIGETGIALGLDLSFRSEEKFAFSVISSSDKYKPHALAGKYVGASASATVGVGLGAAALVGGSNDSFGLNPLALESNQGFGISGGIGFLYLQPAN